MRAMMVLIFLASCLLWESQSVWVMDDGLSFPLDAVKTLKRLLQASISPTSLPPILGSPPVCASPSLPSVFLPVCHGEGAGVVFDRLVAIITPPDPCEICANAACTGC